MIVSLNTNPLRNYMLHKKKKYQMNYMEDLLKFVVWFFYNKKNKEKKGKEKTRASSSLKSGNLEKKKK